MIDGLATFIRYLFYLTVFTVTLNEGIHIKIINRIIFLTILICIFSTFIGLLMDRFVFLNGWNRLMGANYTPVGLALESSLCLFLIYLKFNFLDIKRKIPTLETLFYITSALIILYSLYMTGSRGPMLGVIALFFFHIFFNFPKLLIIFFILFIVNIEYLFQAISDSSYRLFTLFTQLQNISDVTEISDIGDGSIFARLNYIKVGTEFVLEENLAFGAGLNSFPSIYEFVTGKDSVAPHNDFLLVLIEFGYVGLAVFLITLIWITLASIIKRNIFTIAILIFWFFGYSLNNAFYYHSIGIYIFMMFALSFRYKSVTKNA